MSHCVYEKGGCKKYFLKEEYLDIIPFYFTEDIKLEYASLYTSGAIRIAKGYEWDGPSGPTFDTDTFMDGALVHDVLYQMIREGWLPMKRRKEADICLKAMCLADGMSLWRATYVYWAVRLFGAFAARRKQ